MLLDVLRSSSRVSMTSCSLSQRLDLEQAHGVGFSLLQRSLSLGFAFLLAWGAFSSTACADPVDDYNVALTFYKQQRWEQSAEEFQKFLKAYPTHERTAAARLYEGDAYIRLKQFEAARTVFRDFAKSHAEHQDLYISMYRAGECSYFLADYDVARTELIAFLAKFPKHELAEWALEYLGETELQLKQPARAIEVFAQLMKQFPKGHLADEARYLSARAYLDLGKQAEGVALYRQLAAGESARAADAQLDIAMLLFEQKEFDRALAEFDDVTKRFPKSKAATLASLNGGFSCYQTQKFTEAAARFSAILNDPTRGEEARFWLGMSHKSLGKYDLAIESLKMLAQQGQSPELASKARFYWGHSELLQQHFPESLALFREVAEQKPPGPLAPDALHLATEAALLAEELDESTRLHDLFRRDYPQHSLLQRQRLLHGRTLMARGDALLTSNGPSPTVQQTAKVDAEYAAAEMEFASVVADSQIESTSREATLYLARAQMRRQADAKVVDTLAPIAKAFAGSTVEGLVPFGDALIVQAEALLKLNRNQEAADVAGLYLEKLPTGPSVPSALGNLAIASARLDQPNQTSAALDRLWKIQSAPAREMALTVTYQAAEACYARKQWDQAKSLFQRLVDAGPSRLHASGLSGLAYSEYEAGQFAAAAAAFGSFVTSHPEDIAVASSAARMKGLALRQAGDEAAADSAFQAAWKGFALKPAVTDPSPAQLEAGWNAFLSAKGWALGKRKQGLLDDAEVAYQAAYDQLLLQPKEKVLPEQDRLLLEWALLHYEAEKYARSDELFRTLMKECPASEYADDARLYVAESDYFADRFDAAKKGFQELLKQEGADDFVRHRSLVLLLDIAERNGETDEVIALSQQMAKEFPQSDQVQYSQYRLGESLLKKDDAKQASVSLQMVYMTEDAAIRKAEWFVNVRLLLAEALLRQKDYAGVDRLADEFARDEPNSTQLYKMDEIIGRRYKNQAKFDEARAAFLRVVDSKDGRKTETAAQAQLMIAETYMVQEKYDTALSEYYKLYVNYAFPDYQAPALFAAGQCDEALRRWDGAIKTYETLLKEFPTHEYAEKAKPRLEQVKKYAGA